jgi:[ribosomal protein S5]-alanine N-acetyltransferase
VPSLIPPVIAPGSLAATAQPTIAVDGELTLAPFEVADVPAVLAAFADVDIQRWNRRRIDEAGEAGEWVHATHDGWRAETAATWAARTPAGEVLGRVTLYPRLEAGAGEVTYWVLPAARRREVATRATRALTRWAHHEVGLLRMELRHSVLNPGSCRVAERAGYRAEGTLRQALLHDDGWHDMHLHAHLATDDG